MTWKLEMLQSCSQGRKSLSLLQPPWHTSASLVPDRAGPRLPKGPAQSAAQKAQETEHTSSKSLVLMTSMTYAQAEGAAIAAAVFASVGRAEAEAQPDETLPDQDGPGLHGSEPARPRVRSRKPKRKPDATPEDAEAALHMKAEAARIAAEAFASVPQASQHSNAHLY